jgi:hypothetical protein
MEIMKNFTIGDWKQHRRIRVPSRKMDDRVNRVGSEHMKLNREAAEHQTATPQK